MSQSSSDSKSFNFLAQQVDAFYAYMAEVYLEYFQLKEKPVIKVSKEITVKSDAQIAADTNGNAAGESTAKAMETLVIEEPKVQSFAEYFLYKLYYNYGIKRRTVSPDISLLFYAKGLKGYKATNMITMLCRHMMLDTRNMRIISLGVPKAMKLEEFCQRLSINPEDAATNLTNDGIPKITMYRFPEGTMMTYNPSLAKYNVPITESANQNMDCDDGAGDGAQEAQTHSAEIEANIQEQFERHFSQQDSQQAVPTQMQYSTRKVLGTGRFSSLKTFMEMFNENNAAVGVNLESIPAEVIQDKVLVFNIEHLENRVVSALVRNYNTLCAVYQLKSDAECTQQYVEITNNGLVQGVDADNETRSRIHKGFQELGRDMVIPLDLNEFHKTLSGFGVSLFLPDSIRSFGNILLTNTPELGNTLLPNTPELGNTLLPNTPELGNTLTSESKTINILELSINQLNDIVQSRPKDFQGYIIYGRDGSRTKIMNTQYKELKTLKGNKPIVIEQWNTKNLFYLYWRLMKLQLLEKFIAEFDMTGGWSYNQLFYWFATLAHGYSVNLFRVYHNSFVRKSMDKYNIPYSMKPMCGDLHNMYRANKVPISQSMVEQYVFSQSAGKIFWRLFSGK